MESDKITPLQFYRQMKQITIAPVIIGNKPYKKLKVNKLLDSFAGNIRCNMGIPKENNGSIKDELAVCSHIFDNFLKQKSDWDTVVKIYGEEYKEEYLKYFYDNFSTEDYNSVWYADASNVCGRYNNFLEHNRCPDRFNKQPRTGFVCVLERVLSGGWPFVFGFSLTEETRKSYYVNDFVFQREDDNRSCHSKHDEIEILRWLHEKKFIDATLCMLKDESSPILECGGLEPSSIIVGALQGFYGQVIIK
mgnify:FL=1